MFLRLIERVYQWLSDHETLDDCESDTLMGYIRPGEQIERPSDDNKEKKDNE